MQIREFTITIRESTTVVESPVAVSAHAFRMTTYSHHHCLQDMTNSHTIGLCCNSTKRCITVARAHNSSVASQSSHLRKDLYVCVCVCVCVFTLRAVGWASKWQHRMVRCGVDRVLSVE